MSVTPDLRLLQPRSVGFVYCLLVFWFLCGEVLGISFSFTEQLEEVQFQIRVIRQRLIIRVLNWNEHELILLPFFPLRTFTFGWVECSFLKPTSLLLVSLLLRQTIGLLRSWL